MTTSWHKSTTKYKTYQKTKQKNAYSYKHTTIMFKEKKKAVFMFNIFNDMMMMMIKILTKIG